MWRVVGRSRNREEMKRAYEFQWKICWETDAIMGTCDAGTTDRNGLFHAFRIRQYLVCPRMTSSDAIRPFYSTTECAIHISVCLNNYWKPRTLYTSNQASTSKFSCAHTGKILRSSTSLSLH